MAGKFKSSYFDGDLIEDTGGSGYYWYYLNYSYYLSLYFFAEFLGEVQDERRLPMIDDLK